ncbi:MAG: tetratricopeptide repeat protein, partial [Gammaproteobacteria bacterium]
LLLLPVTNPYYNELFVNYKINLAQLHMRLEEYDKANEIYLSLLPKKINLNEINHNIGSLNLALGAAGKAIGYFRKVHYQNNKVVRLYNSIGEAFFNLNQYDSAAFYYQKATTAFQALGQNTDKVGYGLVLKNKGDLHLRNGKDTDAIRFYQQAIHQFYPTFADTALAANPHQFSGVFSYINLFNVLKAKADAWHRLYETTKNLSAAVQELDAYRSAFELIDYVERTYESDEARLFLTKIKYAVHGKPIDIAFELYTKTKDAAYLELLYAFDQQNKAAVLALNRQINSEAADNNSPQLEKERQIKTEITRLAIRASQVTDSVQLAAISSSIRDQEIALSKVQEELQPNAVLKTSGIPPIKTLQTKLLDDKTAIVSYHLGAEKMTTLVIGKNTVACYQQLLPRNFNELMQEEIQRVKTPGNALQSNDTINLFQFFLQHVPLAGLHQLII